MADELRSLQKEWFARDCGGSFNLGAEAARALTQIKATVGRGAAGDPEPQQRVAAGQGVLRDAA